jgi:KipI family sensor histidine kinase inhibitor
MAEYPRFAPVGDSALTVEFGDAVDPDVNARVIAFDHAVAVSDVPGIIETVPSFRSLLVVYEPEVVSFESLAEALAALLEPGLSARAIEGRSWTIPVAYGAPDDDEIREIAAAKGLTADQVIEIHSGAEYQVYLIGFVPGLPVLGGLPEALQIPRRATPRHGLPTGRVMIGGMQGLIVPMPMPTGYHSLGMSPVRPYMPGRTNPFLFRTGDRIRFKPISVREYDTLSHVPSEYFLNRGE